MERAFQLKRKEENTVTKVSISIYLSMKKNVNVNISSLSFFLMEKKKKYPRRAFDWSISIAWWVNLLMPGNGEKSLMWPAITSQDPVL
jgi:hypothetical protein